MHTQKHVDETATLRISSGTLSPTDITRLMGISPTTEHRIGEPMSSRTAATRKFTENMWFLESSLSPTETLSRHLDDLTKLLQARKTALMPHSRELDIQLLCRIQHRGAIAIPGDLVERVSGLSVGLFLDVYC